MNFLNQVRSRLRKIARIAFMSVGVIFGFANATQAQSTNSVWQHHIAAWEARSLDDIVADYDEDSVLILNNNVFRGKAVIRKIFASLFDIFDHGRNRIDTPTLAGKVVFITWHFSPVGEKEIFGTDTFIIERGKIALQTIASPLYDGNSILRN